MVYTPPAGTFDPPAWTPVATIGDHFIARGQTAPVSAWFGTFDADDGAMRTRVKRRSAGCDQSAHRNCLNLASNVAKACRTVGTEDLFFLWFEGERQWPHR